MPRKKSSGSQRPASESQGDNFLKYQGPPGTSTPTRFTNSWNIWVWWVSSVTSCVQYRNSGEPFGSFIRYSMTPRINRFSNCMPTFATLAQRHMPIAICRSSGRLLYQSLLPKMSLSGRIQRRSFGVTAYSASFQAMSTNGSKCWWTEPSERRSSISWYSASLRRAWPLAGAAKAASS